MSSLQNPKIAQLILAAGASNRMGEPKQLLPWKNTTLIDHAISQSLVMKEVSTYVVLGAYYDSIYRQISQLPVTVINNPDWERGMGSSIQVGIKAILKDIPTLDAALISLIDQPLIPATHYKDLITSFAKNNVPIVASDLGNRIGVPAIFSKRVFKELVELKEDYGARFIIKKYLKAIKTIPLTDQGIDIDTQEQYQKIVAIFSNQ
ncbi:nucleotidyltransferase family protein [Aquimarina gracilis]|uniref:Nucleotidyltransferase family protein n=1 Tax=Aquimarina gracilis TaxID=874422 RepID=A0ABU6A265_9FLAO|nr:nucleotidyltransferase family protein [Aquimarina gracilis]MEB3348265.1 nucleotidyltransferase family protein [Aquimarina gracilis]